MIEIFSDVSFNQQTKKCFGAYIICGGTPEFDLQTMQLPCNHTSNSEVIIAGRALKRVLEIYPNETIIQHIDVPETKSIINKFVKRNNQSMIEFKNNLTLPNVKLWCNARAYNRYSMCHYAARCAAQGRHIDKATLKSINRPNKADYHETKPSKSKD